MALKDILVKHQQLQKEMEDSGKAEFLEWFKDYFKKYPFITEVRWEQYTPYFNDGDACEFSVRDPNIRVSTITAPRLEELGLSRAWDHEEDDEEGTDEEPGTVLLETGYFQHKDVKDNESDKLIQAAVNELAELFKAEDLFQLAFGDHVVVAVTKEEITIDDYDHD